MCMDGIAVVLTKAVAYIGIIVAGYGLKRLGIFKQKDFYVLSKIIVTITLPCVAITTFSKNGMDASMLIIFFMAMLCNVIMVSIALAVSVGKSKEERTFNILNIGGYNVGTFTMPFIQNFLGATGFVTTSLFAAGNSVMCMGFSYSLAAVMRGKERPTLKSLVKTLLSSIPFDCYIIMIVLSLLEIRCSSGVCMRILFSAAISTGGASGTGNCTVCTGGFGDTGLYRETGV